jgi:transposase
VKSRPNTHRTVRPIIPQPLKTLNPHTAGIDIGSAEIYVAVPADRDKEPVRVFKTFTRDLHELACWLRTCGITSVAMESTGVYWIPLYDLLEHSGLDVCLINARQLKFIKKKTDVLDCQWIQQLHSYGLLNASFRPTEGIRRFRTISRQRDMLLRYRAAHIQHMQKALHEMNIQLDNVISDLTGTTGLAILRSIVAGERNPVVLAQYRDPHCRCSEEEIVKSLEGSYLDEHLFALAQALELYDFYTKQILDCDSRLFTLYQSIEPSPGSTRPLPPSTKAKKRGRQDPPYDLRTCLYRLCGVDLTQVDGLNAVTAQMILTETGAHFNKWNTSKHFASWLGLSPNNKVSGGKVLHQRPTPTANRATMAFRLAARSLHHSKSALGAYYRRLMAKHGPQVAIMACAHKLARIVYAMISTHTEYRDLGEHYYEERFRDRTLRHLMRKAANLGFHLVALPESPQLSAGVS